MTTTEGYERIIPGQREKRPEISATPTATPNSPARHARISQWWSRNPHLTFEQVAEQVDAEMAQEAVIEAEQAAKTREMSDSLSRMMACPVCGVGNTMGSKDGLCPPCSRTAWVIASERAAEDQIQGHSRRELVQAWIERMT